MKFTCWIARIGQQRSVEDQVSHCVKLHVGDHAADELQEDEQGEVGFDLMSAFRHGVRHGLEDGRVPARVDSGHHDSLQEGEFLHREGLVEVFALDVEADVGVADRHAVLSGTEEHPRRVVVLIVDDVHLVVAVVLLLLLFLSHARALQHHDLVIALLDDLVLRLLFLGLEAGVESPPADGLLEQQVLLVLLEILTIELLLLSRLPLPAIADLDQMTAGPLELIGRQLPRKLEHVLLGRRTPLLAQFLHSLIEQILAPVNPAAHQEQIIR